MVFGGDTGIVGCADGAGALGTVIGGGRHEDGAAGNDAGGAFGVVIGGVDDVRSFGVVGTSGRLSLIIINVVLVPGTNRYCTGVSFHFFPLRQNVSDAVLTPCKFNSRISLFAA